MEKLNFMTIPIWDDQLFKKEKYSHVNVNNMKIAVYSRLIRRHKNLSKKGLT